MSFVKKLLGAVGLGDDGAGKRLAEQQAAAIRQQTEATTRQSRAIADQQAQQARLAQSRAAVEEQARLMTETSAPEAVEVEIGDPAEESASRRRRAYQNPNTASGAIRI